MQAGYRELTYGWESAAGHGPRLRGRRANGADATIHFLSGNGFCGGVYWTFLRRFLPQYGLFLHDIEGHGDSDPPARFSGISALAGRVPEVMREQGLLDGRPPIGMGHSFGAALTLKIAADNPGLFKALVLLDPIVLPPTVWIGARIMSALGIHPMPRAARRRRRSWPSREDAIERLRGRGIYAGWPEEALTCFVDYATRDEDGRRVLSCPPELEAEIYERPVYPWPSFRKVNVPVLFLYGTDSYPFFPAASRLARRLNRKVLVQAAPGRHCFLMEDPAFAHAAVNSFLNGVPG